MHFIFDLDQTLIDTSPCEHLRRSRDWEAVYKVIPSLKPYKFINDLLSYLKGKGCKIGIVTSSPGTYCKKIIQANKWQIDTLVAYHDTVFKKPYPDPIIKALSNMNASSRNTFSIGDRDIMSRTITERMKILMKTASVFLILKSVKILQ